MISWWQALLLGFVQGVTEFLPISSSGHLVLMQELLGVTVDMVTFDVALHTGTLLAVLVFFWRDIISLKLRDWMVVAVGTLPVVFGAVLLGDTLDVLFGSVQVVLVGLLITGGINVLADRRLQQPIAVGEAPNLSVSFRSALLIGIAQLMAVVPGISRSGSTVFAGLYVGLDRRSAFRFSFLLSIPAIIGANILHVQQSGFVQLQSLGLASLGVGMIAALASGFVSLKLLEYMIVSAKLRYFGWYCFGVAGLVLLYLLLR